MRIKVNKPAAVCRATASVTAVKPTIVQLRSIRTSNRIFRDSSEAREPDDRDGTPCRRVGIEQLRIKGRSSKLGRRGIPEERVSR